MLEALALINVPFKTFTQSKLIMGLKSFLKEQGFITDEPGDQASPAGSKSDSGKQPDLNKAPVFFPYQQTGSSADSNMPPDPSFVSPLPQSVQEKDRLDPTFVKFFEDELVKTNLPGPDYFEFRQSLIKTHQKMAATGVVAPEVILQAVLMSFEAQDVSRAKLKESALHYKDVLKLKNDDFLKGAAVEKNNLLQKRQTVVQSHNEAIKKIKQQLDQLEIQKQQLNETLAKEVNQMDVDKSLGKEAIEKIERAEQMITLAHNHIQLSIDNDISKL